jgi:hypothetical protein
MIRTICNHPRNLPQRLRRITPRRKIRIRARRLCRSLRDSRLDLVFNDGLGHPARFPIDGVVEQVVLDPIDALAKFKDFLLLALDACGFGLGGFYCGFMLCTDAGVVKVEYLKEHGGV